VANLNSPHRPASGVALVGAAVVLSIASAVVLKLGAAASPPPPLLILVTIGCALLLNLARLAVWGTIHSRFPLSWAYPLSAAFFPAMLGVSAAFGEAMGASDILGAGLITIGVSWMVTTANAPAGDSGQRQS
jgi:hypothetical protein